MIERLFRTLAPLAALALSSGLSGCGDVDLSINGKEGVPLAELDTEGAAPTELVVAANAKVIVTVGDSFDVAVEGDSEDALRFVLDEDTFGVTLDRDREIKDGKATVRVTMAAPTKVVIAGSGSVELDRLGANPELVIGGSGSISFGQIAAETLEVTIGGSGAIKGAGTVTKLEITVGGSGNVDLAGLQADDVEVSIGGSGDVAFASDGKVAARIAGSGDVQVTGSATCTVKALGSGTLTCGPATEPEAGAEPSETALTDDS